ncbi:MAG TPA: glycosyltransferase family 39 protein [Acidimicrobiia bacterium]|nr:glycosyltransferase family 39 protein [Acidimicrobiia bacterium]
MRRGSTKEPASRPVVLGIVGVILAVGTALHAWFLSSPLRVIDSDEAVVGLMARNLLDGDFEPFFLGQHYGSSHESIGVAALMALQVPQDVAMRVVPMLFFAAAAVLVWRIGRRVVGEPGASIAGALAWAAPAGLVWMSVKERGFYGATLAFGLAAMLFALRFADERHPRDAVLLGFFAGSAVWASPQSIYLLLPAAVWVTVVAVRRFGWGDSLRSGAVVAVSAVVGALPWIVANVRRDWASLDAPTQPPSTYFERLDLFWTRGFAVVLGFRHPFTSEWFGGTTGQVAYALAAVALFAGLAVWLVKRPEQRRTVALVAGAIVAYPFVFAALPTSWFMNDPRYVTFLPPLVAVVVGALALRHVAWAAGAAAVMLVLSVIGTNAAVEMGDTWGRWDVAAYSVEPVGRLLESEGVDAAFADYWIAYRLTFATEERVAASPLTNIRTVPVEEEARCGDAPAYVTYRGSADVPTIEHALRERDVDFETEHVGAFTVVLPEERVLPEEIAPLWESVRVGAVDTTRPPSCPTA